MEKIAIYGGSFDPPHKGHKLLALNLAKACGAGKVIIIPAATSPFKEGTSASSEDRLNMCRLAFDDELFEVSDVEIKRGGKSYTVDTVAHIKSLYPEARLYLFMGEDMLLSFNKWYKYKEILQMCSIVAACRTENLEKLEEMKRFAFDILGLDGDRAIICESTPIQISSTEIRESIKNGTVKELDDNVFKYIELRGLYK